jgi:asparagine synthase (glutamine-hydrolysing)
MMAVQAGAFFFDGRPATGQSRAIVSALNPLAPDGVTVASDEGITLASGAVHTWTGDRAAQQPARSPSGLVMTWDGRLDNRTDLLLRLGERISDRVSDVSIAIAVFERWRADGLRSLIGDWSLVIWDSARRTLHLARDYMGVRPLYYYVDDRLVMWSTSLGDLAVRAGRLDELNEAFVVGYMTGRFLTDVTPYRGIRAVPAATCVSIDRDKGEVRRRFWQLAPGRVRYRNPLDYGERLRELWSDAVGARLRSRGTVWSELSGGLDSSSVVCMASGLISGGRVDAQAIQPISHATLQSPEGDERRFIAEIESATGTKSRILGVEEHEHLRDPDADWVTPYTPRGVGLASHRCVRENGGRVVLSGRVGDLVMGCDPENMAAVFDDFASGRVITGLANVRRWCLASKRPFIEVAGKLAIGGLRRRSASEPQLTEAQCASLALLSPRMDRLWPHRDRVGEACAGVPLSKRNLAAQLLAYSLGGLMNIPALPFDITFAYPFIHRPLVEYMLAIPGEQLSAPGEPRSLMRRAFEGFVPARVLRRTSKGYYPPSALRAARGRAADLLPVDRLEVVARDWIDPVRLDAAIRTLVDGSGHTGSDVRRVLHLEEWLSTRQRRGPAITPPILNLRKEVTSHEVLNA